MNLDRFLTRLSKSLTEVVVAYLMAFIAAGGDPVVLAKIILAIKLNIFAVPLSWTPALDIPLWCWYPISVVWLNQWLRLSGYTAADIAGQLEEVAAAIGIQSQSDGSVATDGGTSRQGASNTDQSGDPNGG